jgi:non-ribosomal peptide synthase protein (TIGR01720 family)
LELPRPEHFNQGVVLEISKSAGTVAIGQALHDLASAHDAFWIRFERGTDGWRQSYMPEPGNDWIRTLEVAAKDDRDAARIITSAADEIQASFDLGKAPLFRALILSLSVEGPLYLVLVGHHLVIDTVSWNILIDDLSLLLSGRHLPGGELARPDTLSFADWAAKLSAFGASQDMQNVADQWRTRVPAGSRPLLMSSAEHTPERVGVVSVSLERSWTERIIDGLPSRQAVRGSDAILAAFLLALSHYPLQDGILVDVESHGRAMLPGMSGTDWTHTVGWFTAIYPAWFPASALASPEATLSDVAQFMRTESENGFTFGVLRYLSAYADQLSDFPRATMKFNYLGRVERTQQRWGMIELSNQVPGKSSHPDNSLPYLLCFDAWVEDGLLCANFSYRSGIREEEAQALARRFIDTLKSIAERV